jgi:hypothetical protein
MLLSSGQASTFLYGRTLLIFLHSEVALWIGHENARTFLEGYKV